MEQTTHEKIKLYHTLFFRIYLYFTIILSVFAFLIGLVFIELYEQNMVMNYEQQLLGQAQKISSSISTYMNNEDIAHFNSYIIPWEEMLNVESTDMWILPNEHAVTPMSSDFVNININLKTLSKDMEKVIASASSGKSTCIRSYEEIYGQTIIRVSTPIYDGKGDVAGILLLNNYLNLHHKLNDNSKSIFFASILFALLISFVIAILFARLLAKPISDMRVVAFQYANGNYEYPTNISRKDEIGELATALDILSVRLTENEKERQYLEQMRLDFFANVSHELRTPITVVRGYTETLLDGIVTNPDRIKTYYQRILKECKSMERLVGDLLLLSKMQNPDFQIEKEPVNLIQIFDDLLRSANMLCLPKQISIEFQKDIDFILIMGDYDRLRQMFLVILDNAVKFSPENSTIHVSIKTKNDICISIRDEGIGIAREEINNIFEKFYKSKLRQNATGSGLGLMIAKQIALKHNAEILVNSTLGEGTEFIFLFKKEEILQQ